MQELNVHDTVSDIINCACERFAPLWAARSENIQAVLKCSKIIEEMVPRHDIHSIDFEVSEETMEIGFSIICSELVLDAKECKDQEVLKLIRIADSFKVKQLNEEEVEIKIALPSIWERQF